MTINRYIPILLLFVFLGEYAAAQINIDNQLLEREDVRFETIVKREKVDLDYINAARIRADKRERRKKHNYIEFKSAINGSLTSYNDPWIETSGGDNTITLLATLYFNHYYTKNKFSLDTKVDAKFGYNYMKVDNDGAWFKNQDEFALSVAPFYALSKVWSVGSIIKFRSQFTEGYVSRTEQKNIHHKSSFMAPAYFDASFGFNYTSPLKAFPIRINLSPVATNAVFVFDDEVRRNNFLYGVVNPSQCQKWEGGSSIQIDFDKTFDRRGVFRYRTSIYGFYGWFSAIAERERVYSDFAKYKQAIVKWSGSGADPMIKPLLAIHPLVRWENVIEIKASKYFTTTLNFQLYYNRAQNLDIQTQTLLSVGLAYTFKNRDR